MLTLYVLIICSYVSFSEQHFQGVEKGEKTKSTRWTRRAEGERGERWVLVSATHHNLPEIILIRWASSSSSSIWTIKKSKNLPPHDSFMFLFLNCSLNSTVFFRLLKLSGGEEKIPALISGISATEKEASQPSLPIPVRRRYDGIIGLWLLPRNFRRHQSSVREGRENVTSLAPVV